MRAHRVKLAASLCLLLIVACSQNAREADVPRPPQSTWQHGAARESPANGARRTVHDELARVGAAPLAADAPAAAAPASLPAIDSLQLPPTDPIPTGHEFNREAYAHQAENEFLAARDNPLSTFSIDIDTASYSNVRRLLRSGVLPPAGAVRIEEFVNYFRYSYPQPTNADPFSVQAEVAGCPWRPQHRLLRLGLQGRAIDSNQRPAGNLVFLIDVSGSMQDADKLPLVQRALVRMVEELHGDDRVALVTYAGSAGIVLDSTSGDEQHTILTAIERLAAGGSTHGSQGILTAYDVARRNFIAGGINRVVLCTDGDFNVGVTSEDELVRLIERERASGVFLSVLGFGTGNYQDSRMEQLADHGNGNYAYIDSFAEAHKVLVEQLSGTLVAIAKDVKIQVEFNPAQVAAYRLIGYENRRLAAEDFRDDQKDAGEIGAGHTVTALYELVPVGAPSPSRDVPELRYQQASQLAPASDSGELLTVRLRYKQPDADVSTAELVVRIRDERQRFESASRDFQFAAAVAGFGMLLRNSEHAGDATWDAVLEWARPASGDDASGYRAEFLTLVERAQELQPQHVSQVRVR